MSHQPLTVCDGPNIYLDFNATTPLAQVVFEKSPEWMKLWGNPSSIHWTGRGPKSLLRQSRETIAQHLGCKPVELIFTSGGSEANSLAVSGVISHLRKTNKLKGQVLYSSVEHPSLRNAMEELKGEGIKVCQIPVFKSGELDVEAYKELLKEPTDLVSVMYANNETGNVFPIQQLAGIAHDHGALFHCDAVQALGKAEINFAEWGVDFASLSSHKFYSLKGSGLLFAKAGLGVEPIVYGGKQERGRRAGTENLLSIASWAHMFEMLDDQESHLQEMKKLRDAMESRILNEIGGVVINGSEAPRIGNTMSATIDDVDGESLLMNLDLKGFSVSTGAACSSGNPEPSPVLLAMGLTRKEAQSSLRVSLGWSTTEEQINSFVDTLKEVVEHLRGEKKRAQKKRVLVAMSGGVDSSVAASLLVEQGYEVIGCTMQVWDYSKNQCAIDEGQGTCCSSKDVDDARQVAEKLGIPFYVLNCEEKFEKAVIDDFVNSYVEGKTPIPCVNCNTYLKFDHLIKKMKELDCDYLATGHYAQIQKDKSGTPRLITSEDGWKDQTYFLFTMNPELLDKLIFPVGDWEKPKLREYAEEKDLVVARKKDSTGICFIGKQSYKTFLKDRMQESQIKKGDLKLYPSGEVLGKHDGIHNFTFGQRKGLGISSDRPLYVVKVNADDHVVWLGEEKDLYGKSLELSNANWLDDFSETEDLRVKIRFQHAGAKANLEKLNNGRYRVKFSEPQRSITPGQAAVVYRGKQLLGGGWIQK